MGDTSWIAWSGWSFVGNTAQVLSLVAIIIAIVEVLAQRKKVPPVAFSFDIIGVHKRDEGSFHIVTFGNAGNGAAHIMHVAFAQSRCFETDGHRFKTIMGSGDSIDLLISAEKIEDAWVLITWRSLDRANIVRYSWYPLSSSQAARDEWIKSQDRTKTVKWWQEWQRGRNPCAIGPSLAVSTSVRRSSKQNVFQERALVVYSGLDDSIRFSSWSLMGAESVEDLPFVKPVPASA